LFLSIQVLTDAQNPSSSPQKGSPAKEEPPYKVQIGSKVAETLLIHKEAPCQKDADGVRVTGTVVIDITIDKNDGNVTHPHTLSGPKMLRPLAIATGRKYRYRPYLLNKNPVEVETVVSISIVCIFHPGQA
jgi:protein TonB